jgi:hypothetical protein
VHATLALIQPVLYYYNYYDHHHRGHLMANQTSASGLTYTTRAYTLLTACDTRIRVSQAAAINSLRMANALLAPG